MNWYLVLGLVAVVVAIGGWIQVVLAVVDVLERSVWGELEGPEWVLTTLTVVLILLPVVLGIAFVV